MKNLSIAIAGNPNAGKTTLFNALTGSHQHVGNWPGVTVEKIEGQFDYEDTTVRVVDLPGIYSFSAFSIDESIAREHILQTRPDLVVNIVDATNLERNLYLTTQLIEIRTPMVVVLNMMDVAARRRLSIEIDHLARHLDCPVIPVVATKRTGIDTLRAAIVRAAREGHVPSVHVAYDAEMEKAIGRVREAVKGIAARTAVDARWLALKLLEGDEIGMDMAGNPDVLDVVRRESVRVHKHIGDELDIVVADGRYGFIHGLVRDVVRSDNIVRRTVSDNIDKVLLNRILGVPLFLGIMYLVFVVTIHVSSPFIAFFDRLCRALFVDGFSHLLAGLNAPAWTSDLLASGVGGGIQTVASFIPPIFFIFLCLSFLEDSGYMARAAFVMDRFLRMIGLPGKAFIPMLIGFGCNVPAIMATRTLENPRDRILTILINPFISCGARLPVYTLFIAAFFPRQGGPILFGLYLTGIVMAVGTGLLFKQTILAGEATTFVMELPPYHVPTVRGVLYHAWNRIRSFIVRAGRVILAVAVILSLLNRVGTADDAPPGNQSNSLLATVGQKVAPVFAPLGVTRENWPAAVGLFTGLLAKEAVVGTLDTLYSPSAGSLHPSAPSEPDFNLGRRLADAFAAIPEGFDGFFAEIKDPLGLRDAGSAAKAVDVAAEMNVRKTTLSGMVSRFDGKIGAIAYLLFILTYCPCVAVIAVIYRETNARWALFSAGYMTLLAWLLSTAFYQAGTFVRHPGSSTFWLALCAAVFAALVGGLKLRARLLRAPNAGSGC